MMNEENFRRLSRFAIDRRTFIQGSCGLTALGAASSLHGSWLASTASKSTSNRILIVIQLTGGNDGLNTVIPYRNELYRKARPKLGIPEADVLKVDDELGFHPSCRGLADLMEAGQLAVVHGVGYPFPNRSHFESMDIWHTCYRKDARVREGWLGRFMAQHRNLADDDAMGLHFGREDQPLALASKNLQVPSIAAIEQFRLRIADETSISEAMQPVQEAENREDQNDLVAFVQAGSSAAWNAGKRIQQVLQSNQELPPFPATQLGEKLSVVARLITASLNTRIYYVTLDGFDTHALQPAAHASLLRQWSEALASFMKYLDVQGRTDDVLVFTFSEFGRRVAENASDGTDHGAAAPVFIAGGSARNGFLGSHPSLDDLDDGDLKFQFDFRQIYATFIEHWFGVEGDEILGAKFEPSPFLNLIPA